MAARGSQRLLQRGLLWLLVAQLGCASWGQQHYAQLRQDLRQGHAALGLAQIEEAKKGLYGDKNRLLYWLDRAVLQQANHDFAASNASLEQGKQTLLELYTKHVTDHAEAFLLGDTHLPYIAEPFEQVAMHLLEASNYLAQGSVAGAGVELRQMGSTLRRCNALAQQANSVYADDAAGRWLAGVLREADLGELARLSDAAIDYRQALAVYEQTDAQLYGTPPPRALIHDLARVLAQLPAAAAERRALQQRYPFVGPSGAAAQHAQQCRAYLLYSDGEAPQKEEAFWTAFLGYQIVRVAYPVFLPDRRAPGFARLSAPAQAQEAYTELASDFGAKAQVHLQERMGSIQGKAVARALAKFAAGETLSIIGGNRSDTAGGLMELAGAALSVANLIGEHADVRSWRLLPARLHVAELPVTCGEVALSAEFFDGASQLRAQRHWQVFLQPGQTAFLSYRRF